jgi:hypothetical protein
MNWEDHLGIKASILIAGFMGAVASLLFEDKLSFSRAILILSSGATTAAYLHEPIKHFFSVPESWSAGLGFICGFTAMKILKLILDKAAAAAIKLRQTPNKDGLGDSNDN